jgi:hypothetical protein
LSKAGESSLGLLERRILRGSSGAVQDKDTWRKKCNHGLYKLFNEPDTAKYTRIHRSSLAEHIIRVENRRTVKKVFDTRPEGTRKIGRPRMRWEDDMI